MLVNFEFRHNNSVLCSKSLSVDFKELKRLFSIKMKHLTPCEIYLSNKQIIESFNLENSIDNMIEQLVIPSLMGNVSWEAYHKKLNEPIEPISIAVDYLTFSGFKDSVYRLSCNESQSDSAVLKLCNNYFDDVCEEFSDPNSEGSYKLSKSFILSLKYIDGESEFSSNIDMSKVVIDSLGVESLNNELMSQILDTTNISEVIKDKSVVVNAIYRLACDDTCDSKHTPVVAGFYAFSQCIDTYDNANPDLINLTLRKVGDSFSIEISLE